MRNFLVWSDSNIVQLKSNVFVFQFSFFFWKLKENENKRISIRKFPVPMAMISSHDILFPVAVFLSFRCLAFPLLALFHVISINANANEEKNLLFLLSQRENNMRVANTKWSDLRKSAKWEAEKGKKCKRTQKITSEKKNFAIDFIWNMKKHYEKESEENLLLRIDENAFFFNPFNCLAQNK